MEFKFFVSFRTSKVSFTLKTMSLRATELQQRPKIDIFKQPLFFMRQVDFFY